MTGTECRLCGLPCGVRPILAKDVPFCCVGCREVYLTFGADAFTERIATEADGRRPANDGNETFLRIDGMHCTSCEVLIELLAEKIDGVLDARANYATSTAKITYDPTLINESDIPAVMRATGYQAWLRSDDASEYDYRPDLLRLLVGVALGGGIMMMYLAFYYPVHLGVVDEKDLEPLRWFTHGVIPWIMLGITTIMIGYVAKPIFKGAWVGWRARTLNMDNLLAIAILAAYGYSIGELMSGGFDLYFDVTAAVITVVTIGRYIERNTKADATKELSRILEHWAPKARIRWGGEYRELALEDIQPGEHILVWQDEEVPVDGVIFYGNAAIDESLITGEPFPVAKGRGDAVMGGSVVVDGSVEVVVGADVESQINNLARVLWNVQSGARGAQSLADRLARIFVPLVLVLAAVVTVFAYAFGEDPSAALLAGLTTLIVSCPCTFGLATPLATAVGISTGLKSGIVIANTDAFEKAHDIKTVAIDKTGTLSTGRADVIVVGGEPESASRAAAVERLSSHPIAKAIACIKHGVTAEMIESHPGRGIVGALDCGPVAVGSASLFSDMGWSIPKSLANEAETRRPEDGVISFVGWEASAKGYIITRDQARPYWEALIARLRRNCRVVILTGAEHTGAYRENADAVFSGVPPEGKAAVIQALQNDGNVVMIGDGSNDAPALAAATLGIAFGAPTALAAEAADIIISGERLERIISALELVHTVRRRVRQNLGWAFIYNAIAVPLAVTGLLNPLFAALAMSSSSLLVVWNSSRKIKLSALPEPALNYVLVEQ